MVDGLLFYEFRLCFKKTHYFTSQFTNKTEIVKIISLDNINQTFKKLELIKKLFYVMEFLDLLHVGHLKHFKEAKKIAEILIVSITPDKYVNKGPGRPFFSEQLRLEVLSAIETIDYVVLNDSFQMLLV